MDTVFGFKWGNINEIAIGVGAILILLFLVLLILLKYNQYLQNKKTESYQLFLFKTKQMGLSAFQLKVLNGIIDILRINEPVRILDEPELFESAIGNFLNYLTVRGEKNDSISTICRDLIITYEKLYHPTSYRNSLEDLSELEGQQLLYLAAPKVRFIGKIIRKEGNVFTLEIFRNLNIENQAPEGTLIQVFFWRGGDAEYTFNSKIISIENKIVHISIPKEFERGKEVRKPYIDVIIPCTVTEMENSTKPQKISLKESKKSLNGVIYKLHEDELVIRISLKLDYKHTYEIGFVLSEFKMNVQGIIISERTIQAENVLYFTFRIKQISEAGKKILKKYLDDHL